MKRDDESDQQQHTLHFYATAPHACNYLEDRTSISVFADPDATLSTGIYHKLAPLGFRRSGSGLYMPACTSCNQCIPARVVINNFRRSRNQQRVWQRNRDITCTPLDPVFRQDHFELYSRYLSQRHSGGGMENPAPEDYLGFLSSAWSDTLFLEFRSGSTLLGVAVTDCLPDALSSVYTFFDPDFASRSPGTLAILMQIETARELGLEWLYLGYWIPDCQKMAYKNRFRPLQVFRNGCWEDFDPEASYSVPPEATGEQPSLSPMG